MPVPLLLLGLSYFVGILGCDESTTQTVVSVRIVDGDNGNPVEGTDADTLSIAIQEGELEPRSFTFPIVNESFDAAIEFQSFVSPTLLRALLTGASTTLLSAPPVFVPENSGDFVRLVAAAPSSCESISFNLMEAPRARFGMALSGSFALLVGGTSVAETESEFLDVLQWFSNTNTLDRANVELEMRGSLGDTRVASIDETQILVLPSDTPAFVFDMADQEDRIKDVRLHIGAGVRSAIVSVPAVGAMVIGGAVDGVAQSAVTLVGRDGGLTALQLSTPRSGPAATALGADVLVVGGNEAGDAELLVGGQSTGEPVTSLSDGVREGGALVGDGSSRALLVGGVDEIGALRQDTVEFEACSDIDTCDASPGRAWTTARLDVALAENSTLLIGGTDSALIEEVRWSQGIVAIAPFAELNVARAAPSAVVLESGAFIVGGGSDGGVRLDDFEFCVPAALEPL